MKRRATLLVSLLAIVVSLSIATAANLTQDQDVFVPIKKYIQQGDAERLSAWFAPNLEIDILGTTNVCSKQQAKQILREFFNQYSPKQFEIAYKSGKVPMIYAIGTLNAGGAKFRVTLFVKSGSEGNFIQQLRVERE